MNTESQAIRSFWKAPVDLLSMKSLYPWSTTLGILDLMSGLHPRLPFKTILIPLPTLQ